MTHKISHALDRNPFFDSLVRQKMKPLALIILVLLLSGCSGPERVSVAEFKKEYAAVGQPASMRHVEYLGVRDGRAYIKVSSMRLNGSKWKERVIFVELEELDEALRNSLPQRPNQPLQRNASTGSVSSFESPARRG